MANHPLRVYSAPWVVPIASPPVYNGAVVLDRRTIVDIGNKADMYRKWPNSEKTELCGVLLPPLINCHIHSELSHCTNIQSPQKGQSMVDWIEELLRQRMQGKHDEVSMQKEREKTWNAQKDSGVVLAADITNTLSSSHHLSDRIPQIYSIYEVLAPTGKRAAEIKEQLRHISSTQPISGHAPYSTTGDLIRFLKKRAVANGHVFSIHLAESREEVQFLCTRSGPFRDFLERRGTWDSNILSEGVYYGSVEYLRKLQVLDKQTLCVHCVHVNDKEIEILKDTGAKICLCPGSNEFLGVGHAPLEKMLDAGLLPGIGTDSRASNERLDMWREISILNKNHPQVKPLKLLAMATRGGAIALGREKDFGTIEPGKQPLLLQIDIGDTTGVEIDQLLEKLVDGTLSREINWIGWR